MGQHIFIILNIYYFFDGNIKRSSVWGEKKMAQQLRAYTALVEVLNLVPNTLTLWLTTGTLAPERSDTFALLQLPCATLPASPPCPPPRPCARTQSKENKYLKTIFFLFRNMKFLVDDSHSTLLHTYGEEHAAGFSGGSYCVV